MRITEVNIPKVELANNLADIKMSRLGDIVLVAGENGSGKTRIFKQIQLSLNRKPKKSALDKVQANIIMYEGAIHSAKTQIEQIQESLKVQGGNPYAEGQIDGYRRNIESYGKEILRQQELLSSNAIITNELAESYAYINYVPKSLQLNDSSANAKASVLSLALRADKVGVDHMAEAALSKIQVIQDRWFSATHQNSQVTSAERDKAKTDYAKLNALIEVFFKQRLVRSGDDEATLFGLPLGKANLSDGQKILIQFCLAIYSQGAALKDIIIFMDEPENHLHPKVIIEVIDRIRDCVTNGQIWIATHSVPLLAHYDPKYIWYVEDGKISWAGNTPERVLTGLVGDESEIGRLQDFIGLPAQFAINQYAYESLFEPAVAMTGAGDPQTIQIKDGLKHLMKGGKIRVLDYGAGKGRLLANIMENVKGDKADFLKTFDYVAFDKYQSDKDECCAIIAEQYGNADNRYYSDYKTLFSDYNPGDFEVVVMCNVLHEIDPSEWLTLFEKNGFISKMLNKEGVVLLVEDQQIPIGEKAYQKGFIVLDTPQIKDLFQIKVGDGTFKFDSRNGGRLKAHFIPKECLERITTDTKKDALNSLNQIAGEEIREIRKKERTYANGKIHGFWVQQFANTQLALAEI